MARTTILSSLLKRRRSMMVLALNDGLVVPVDVAQYAGCNSGYSNCNASDRALSRWLSPIMMRWLIPPAC